MGFCQQYRIWDAQKKQYEMSDWFVIKQDGLLYIIGDYEFEDELAPTERYTVQFATGYTDTNGTMIYDGDILKWTEPTNPRMAKFRFIAQWGPFGDCCVEGETWMMGESERYPTVFSIHGDCEVIGTIFENPDPIPSQDRDM